MKKAEICTRLPKFETEKDITLFAQKWRNDFLSEVKDGFITSKIDEICDTLVYFLLSGDESGTLMDNEGTYYFNFSIENENLCFAFYK